MESRTLQVTSDPERPSSLLHSHSTWSLEFEHLRAFKGGKKRRGKTTMSSIVKGLCLIQNDPIRLPLCSSTEAVGSECFSPATELHTCWKSTDLKEIRYTKQG